ncbi:MAG TPA: hypothetical protein VMG08_01325 [Allosphingosinicella sp.]|nr:hypothetical protein [Allosphingosinicella sp.]
MTMETLSIICVCASLVVAGMVLHYVIRARSRTDMLCFLGLIAAQLGLLQSGRAAEGTGNMLYVAGPGFTLFVLAVGIWRLGFLRLGRAA